MITSTIDQELADAAAYALGRRFVFTHQVAALFCVKWCHGRHLDMWCQIEIGIRQSMHIYLKNNPTKFHSDPIWNDWALGFFEEVAPTGTKRRTTTRWVAIRNQSLIWNDIVKYHGTSRGFSATAKLSFLYGLLFSPAVELASSHCSSTDYVIMMRTSITKLNNLLVSRGRTSCMPNILSLIHIWRCRRRG